WKFVMVDSPKYLLRYSYSYIGFVHPTHNMILVACNDHAVGHLVRSTDDGATWKDTTMGSYVKNEPGNFITAIAALDSNHIVILVGDTVTYLSNRAMLTSDGGASWRSTPTPPFEYQRPTYRPVNPAITYLDSITLLVAALNSDPYSVLYRTTDLGITWDTVLRANTLATKFAFINSKVGFASGMIIDFNTLEETSTIDKTTDGGITWARVLTRHVTVHDGLNSIAFADSLHGLACGYEGLILRTTDGGTTWTEMSSDYTADAQDIDELTDVAYPDVNHAMIPSSDGGVLIYHPNGILRLPNITYPHFSPPDVPRTFDITWDPVPGATRYSLTIVGSVVAQNDTLIVRDTNITTTSYHLSNLLDTNPTQRGVQYQMYLTAYNATNESNTAQRIFIVHHTTADVSARAPESAMLTIYPNPASGELTVDGAQAALTITDALGRACGVPQNSRTFSVSRLPAGVYYVSDGHSRSRFVKH
ncbi:MAG: T9SS type A sorting domain-containing protein, partial [Bacteroidota bacterium]|nr:T9SS type A sorting domain-containing protein [Bacteroidota bacterium]